jgi:hypothetical protein
VNYIVFSSFLKKSELISAVWLAGWRPEISELGRDRDFRFFAIASVDCGGSTIIKILNQAPSVFRNSRGSAFI